MSPQFREALGAALRVHIAPVGFEDTRIVQPLQMLHADRVHLVTSAPNDDAAEFWRLVHERLKSHHPSIGVEDHFAPAWNLSATLALYERIIRDEHERGNEVYINLGTGTKIQCMAGVHAAMLWGARPYYPQIDYHKQADDAWGKKNSPVTDIQVPPVLQVHEPESVELDILEFLRPLKDPSPKEPLVAMLRKKGQLPPKSDDLSEPAVYNRLNRILQTMEDAGYVHIKRTGRKQAVSIKRAGSDAVALFRPSSSKHG